MIPGKKILVVDDDHLLHEFLLEILRRKHFEFDSAEDVQSAKNKLNENNYDLVITDLRLPDDNGLVVLNKAKKNNPDTGVIVITAYGTVENAVEAMKIGAFDYLTKPFSADEIEIVIEKYFDYHKLQSENKFLKSQLGKLEGFENIIGKSQKIKEVFDVIQMVADSKATILIQGASGTGKELVAKAIHFNSPRRKNSFIKTNCAAIPDGLVESELFGHEKGAFTGAIKQTRGRFELADGGTLLLDEISEMNLNLQAKLLRVLQEKEFEKVGGTETMEVDVRVIATTNCDLKKLIDNGEFREDLFYRLNVVPIILPALKERKEDILLLAEHFRKNYSEENSRKVDKISDEAMKMLMNYDWPGNVRELENAIERAVVICKGDTIEPDHFLMPYDYKTAQNYNNLNGNIKNLGEIEKKMILQVLEENRGNRTKTAEELGISVRTLRNKIRDFREMGIEIPSKSNNRN